MTSLSRGTDEEPDDTRVAPRRTRPVGFDCFHAGEKRGRFAVLDVARQAVDAARAAGASYADARVVSEESESLTVRNQEMEGVDRSFSQGLGIRVLVDGYWGFAATARTEDGEIARTAALAADIARAASRLPMEPVR